MKKIVVTLTLNILVSSMYCQTNDSIAVKLTEELDKIYTRRHINGFSVAIVNQDGTLYEKGFGYSNIKANKKYTNNTIQSIASVSKIFIGITLLKAQELGKLSLDDPINKHL